MDKKRETKRAFWTAKVDRTIRHQARTQRYPWIESGADILLAFSQIVDERR